LSYYTIRHIAEKYDSSTAPQIIRAHSIVQLKGNAVADPEFWNGRGGRSEDGCKCMGRENAWGLGTEVPQWGPGAVSSKIPPHPVYVILTIISTDIICQTIFQQCRTSDQWRS